MAGAMDWLDNLTSTIGDVAGRAVDAAGNVATARIDAEARRAVTPDQTPVPATSPIQTARPGITIDSETITMLVGFAAVIGLVLIIAKD